MSVPELSIQIKNIPGQLVQVTTVLAEAGVNIRGIAASSSGKAGWIRVLVDQTKIAEEALDECGIAVEVGEALALLLPNETGSLDRALRLLADDRLNVDYIYTCGAHPGNKVLVVLGVQTPGKAEKLLKLNGIEIADFPD